MNNEKIKTLKKYLITSLIALIVTVGLLSAFGLFSGELTGDETIRAFADAFTAVGVLLIALFCLAFVSTQGMFDGLSYVGMVAVRSLVPGMRYGKYEKYGDYKVRKNDDRGDVKNYLFMLFIGLGFTAIGVVFTVLFFVI